MLVLISHGGQVASKTNDVAGDGTTTATVLARLAPRNAKWISAVIRVTCMKQFFGWDPKRVFTPRCHLPRRLQGDNLLFLEGYLLHSL